MSASEAGGTMGGWRLLREQGASGQVWLARKGDSEPAALKILVPRDLGG